MLLAIELNLRCQMCDVRSKFEEDRIKTTVAIVNDKYCEQTDRRTRQTDGHTHVTQVILGYICPMQCIALDKQ